MLDCIVVVLFLEALRGFALWVLALGKMIKAIAVYLPCQSFAGINN